MDNGTKQVEGSTAVAAPAKSKPIAMRGVRTVNHVTGLMAAVISDLATESITAQTANAMCNATGKLLKASDMKLKYGTSDGNGNRPRDLILVPDEDGVFTHDEQARVTDLEQQLAELKAQIAAGARRER